MLFNSLEFFVFMILVFSVYWSVNTLNLRLQNAFLLLSSYIFYGWWDYRFLSLIFLSTLVDFWVGNKIYQSDKPKSRNYFLTLSILFNVGLLGFFKYYNFFIDSMVEAMAIFGYDGGDLWTLNIILPVGISFYTFQTMSYSLDIYYKKVEPTRDFVGFATFVGFFPQLVAGPIERASNLLPQILKKRQFDYKQSVEGLGLILWGLFKKVAIADSLAPIVDDIFSNYHIHSSATLAMGAIFFGFQIYGDFSGYSDIAIGTAKLLGIELRSNFKFPYFSRNIAEFWRRWHISLSTWFRDYMYIPLGGSRVGKVKVIRNVLLIFLVSGFWHGANWTFILWGLFHAILFIPIFLGGTHRKYLHTISVYFKGGFLLEIMKMLITFISVTLGWILFRSENLSSAFLYYERMLTDFTLGTYQHPMHYRMSDYFILLGIFILYEYRIRKDERNPFKTESKLLRFVLYALTALGLLLFFDQKVDRSFIYFQF